MGSYTGKRRVTGIFYKSRQGLQIGMLNMTHKVFLPEALFQ